MKRLLTYVPGETPIVVVGLMGAGKTTIANLLATALDRRVRDSDEDLSERYGMTAAEIAARHGADILHDREAALLCSALTERPAPVIAAAASTVENAKARKAMESAAVVFLDGPPEVLAQRMLSSGHRPHYKDDLKLMLIEQRARRLPAFQAVADFAFDVSASPPERIAASILTALEGDRP
ncbi:shikimate kinase [Thermopolyspora sp. NPDC052614]|uniref:shikimate kinase n=1 Tax=Thermopolyspora sp. NPDC052614 TaxID=3155682 RepID=UPI0034297218